jgi:hypothetical protein
VLTARYELAVWTLFTILREKALSGHDVHPSVRLSAWSNGLSGHVPQQVALVGPLCPLLPPCLTSWDTSQYKMS